MNRRQFLLGSATVVGGGAFAKANADKIPEVPDSPLSKANITGSNSTPQADDGEPVDEMYNRDVIELMSWRYNDYTPYDDQPNNINGWAMAEVKNVTDKTLDFTVRFTPIHKNGTELKTWAEAHEIKPLEYKTFELNWNDDSSKYVDTLRIKVRASDTMWFNGWTTVYLNEHEF